MSDIKKLKNLNKRQKAFLRLVNKPLTVAAYQSFVAKSIAIHEKFRNVSRSDFKIDQQDSLVVHRILHPYKFDMFDVSKQFYSDLMERNYHLKALPSSKLLLARFVSSPLLSLNGIDDIQLASVGAMIIGDPQIGNFISIQIALLLTDGKRIVKTKNLYEGCSQLNLSVEPQSGTEQHKIWTALICTLACFDVKMSLFSTKLLKVCQTNTLQAQN